MDNNNFAHLHVHTDYSLLDGAMSIFDAAKKAVEDGNNGIAMTEHANMGGLYQLSQACKKYDLQAVPGVELYHVSDVNKTVKENKAIAAEYGSKSVFHLTVLAKNQEGLSNLLKLTKTTELGNRIGKYPVCDYSILEKHSKGLVLSTGCMGSMVNQLVINGHEELANKHLERMLNIFGPEDLYVEVANHGIAEQEICDVWHRKIAKEKGLKMLAVNDAHYLNADDAAMHDAVLCISVSKKIADTDRFRFSSNQNYLKSQKEMQELFPEDLYPGACSNTGKLVERIKEEGDIDITFGSSYLIPKASWEIDNGVKKSTSEEESNDRLREICEKKLKSEQNSLESNVLNAQEYWERLEEELNIIKNLGFSDYFLIVSDMTNFAKKSKILVGPGRGSAAGSLVAFLTGITEINPLKYDLKFSRFLNPGRKTMPDIDLDFEKGRRYEVIKYLLEKYGQDSVARIGTYAYIGGKSAIKDAARVLGFPVALGEKISGMYNHPVAGYKPPIMDMVSTKRPDKEDKNGYKWWPENAELRKSYHSNHEIKKILDLASAITGRIRSRGIHAGGILVTPNDVSERFPVHKVPVSKQATDLDKLELPVCSYSCTEVESVGGLKIDILGLKNLDIISRCVDFIEKQGRNMQDLISKENSESKEFDLWSIKKEPRVFKMLSEGKTDSIFQLEGEGMRNLLKEVKPETIDDICAVLALFRPGPLGSGLHLDYAHAKNGTKKPPLPHKDFKDICSDTYGVLTYQEQLINIARHYANFDEPSADDFRKATAKKDESLLSAQYEKFKEGALNNGYSKEEIDKIWHVIPPFSGYAFNKSHAVAYAHIAYTTAYLKCFYPAEFVAACILEAPKEKVPMQIEAARREGIVVFKPDINESIFVPQTSKKTNVFLPLSGIREVGDKAVEYIINEREKNGKYKDIIDFVFRCVQIKEMNLSSRNLKNLIHSGAFDKMHKSRKGMVDNAEEIVEEIKKRVQKTSFDDDSFGIFDEIINEVPDFSDELRQKLIEKIDKTKDFSISEKIEGEIYALGFPSGEHPYAYVEKHIRSIKQTLGNFLTPKESKNKDLSNQKVAGVLMYVKTTKSKDKKTIDGVIEDHLGNQIKIRWYINNIEDEIKCQNLVSGSWIISELGKKYSIFNKKQEEESEENSKEDIYVVKTHNTQEIENVINQSKKSNTKNSPGITTNFQEKTNNFVPEKTIERKVVKKEPKKTDIEKICIHFNEMADSMIFWMNVENIIDRTGEIILETITSIEKEKFKDSRKIDKNSVNEFLEYLDYMGINYNISCIDDK